MDAKTNGWKFDEDLDIYSLKESLHKRKRASQVVQW